MNSTIKQKMGVCPDCPGEEIKPIVGGRCQYHYSKFRYRTNQNKKNQVESNQRKRRLNLFFQEQERRIPYRCENCNNPIIIPYPLPKRTAVAHILEKANYPSVEIHPLNRWFGCPDCHTNYDRKGHDFQAGMQVAPIVVQRFKQFMHLLTPREVARLPDYLYLVYNGG